MGLTEKLAYWSLHNLDPRAQYDYPQQSVGGGGFQNFDPSMFAEMFGQQDVRPWSERAGEMGANAWDWTKNTAQDAWKNKGSLAADAGELGLAFNPGTSLPSAYAKSIGSNNKADWFHNSMPGIGVQGWNNIGADGLAGYAAYPMMGIGAGLTGVGGMDAYKAFNASRGLGAGRISSAAEAARAGAGRMLSGFAYEGGKAGAPLRAAGNQAFRGSLAALRASPFSARALASVGWNGLGRLGSVAGRAALGPVGLGAAIGDVTLGAYNNHVNSQITDGSMIGDNNKFDNYYYKRMAKTDADGLDRTNQFMQEHGKNLQGALTDSSNGMWRNVGNVVNGMFGGSGQVTNYDGYDDLNKRFDDTQRESFNAATKRVYESDPSTPEGMLAREQFRSFSDSASMKRREGEDDNARAHRLFNESATGQGMDFRNTKGWHAQPTTPVAPTTPTIAPTPAPEVAKATPPGGSGLPKGQGTK